jgi:hypothetical protein
MEATDTIASPVMIEPHCQDKKKVKEDDICVEEHPQREGDDMIALYALIEREIVVRGQRHASWKQLDLCHKWRLIQEYLRDARCTPAQFADVRAMLRGNILTNVEYDGARVTRLNVQDI